MEQNILPSNFQVDDYCYLRVNNGSYLHATVTAVKFTKSKVLYDLSVQIDLPVNPNEEGIATNTRLHGVDSSFVVSVAEWDEIRKNPLRDSGALTSFGHYLLSEKRTNRITETFNTYPTSGTLEERMREVYHADIENWLADNNNPNEVVFGKI